jgi:hypothetical protein
MIGIASTGSTTPESMHQTRIQIQGRVVVDIFWWWPTRAIGFFACHIGGDGCRIKILLFLFIMVIFVVVRCCHLDTLNWIGMQ